jgi:hypothetical protein
MKWVTCEYVHVDKTASPWLIKKLIDPKAQFIFVSPEKIEEAAKTHILGFAWKILSMPHIAAN